MARVDYRLPLPPGWTLEMWDNSNQKSSPLTLYPCDYNPIFDFEFWPSYKVDRGGGNVFERYSGLCLFESCYNPAQWSISPGTNGVDWKRIIDYSEPHNYFAEIQFYKPGSYTISVNQPMWYSCPPIVVAGCSTQFTSAPGGTGQAIVNVSISPKNRSVTVSRNTSIPLTTTQIDNALAAGYQQLIKDLDQFPNNSAYDDVVCCLNLVRSGNIFVVDNEDYEFINGILELSQLLSLNYNVNLVNGFWDGSLGKTPYGANKFAAIFDSLVIYHEYGHTRGLDDKTTTDWNGNLMRGSLSQAGWETNAAQKLQLAP